MYLDLLRNLTTRTCIFFAFSGPKMTKIAKNNDFFRIFAKFAKIALATLTLQILNVVIFDFGGLGKCIGHNFRKFNDLAPAPTSWWNFRLSHFFVSSIIIRFQQMKKPISIPIFAPVFDKCPWNRPFSPLCTVGWWVDIWEICGVPKLSIFDFF